MGWFSRVFKSGSAVTVSPPVETNKEYFVPTEDNYIVEPGKIIYFDGTIAQSKLNQCVRNEAEAPPVSSEEAIKVEPIDLSTVDYQQSPNQSPRKAGEVVKYIVLHHTGPGSFNGIVDWLCNKDAKASAHYVVGPTGQLKQLVNTKRQAWHAGRADWNDLKNNASSVGIEICNIGRMDKHDDGFYYYEVGRNLKKYTGKTPPQAGTIVYPSGQAVSGYFVPYPDKQIEKVVALCKALVNKYPEITRDNIVTHYQIGVPEGRKNDPFGLDVEKIKNMIFG